MAKNFVEEGKTVAIVASAAISSGDLVQVGDVFAVALTDIPQGETGDGLTEGVFMLPKLKTDDMKTGKKVYLKSGKVQLKGIPLKLVRQRVRVFKASPSGKMTARIRVNRGNLPAIKLGTARVRLTRRGGKLQYRGSVLKVGKYLFRDAFIQQLANGRWHVMRRIDGKNRYPIDVVKIPLSGPLTQAFEDARDRIIAAEMPKQLGYALKQQLRLWLTR